MPEEIDKVILAMKAEEGFVSPKTVTTFRLSEVVLGRAGRTAPSQLWEEASATDDVAGAAGFMVDRRTHPAADLASSALLALDAVRLAFGHCMCVISAHSSPGWTASFAAVGQKMAETMEGMSRLIGEIQELDAALEDWPEWTPSVLATIEAITEYAQLFVDLLNANLKDGQAERANLHLEAARRTCDYYLYFGEAPSTATQLDRTEVGSRFIRTVNLFSDCMKTFAQSLVTASAAAPK